MPASSANNLMLICPAAKTEVRSLHFFEKALIGIGIFEIPLQLDKYLMYYTDDGMLGAVAGFNVSILLVCLVVLYWNWFLQVMARGPETGRVLRKTFGTTKIFYLAAILVSSLTAVAPFLSYFEFFMVFQGYLLFFYLANRIETREDFLWVLGWLMAALAFQGVVMIGLKLMGSSMYGATKKLGPISFAVWEDGRTAGTMGSAVVAGSVMAMTFLPISGLIFSKTARAWLPAVFVALALGAIGILFTQTRGALITLFFGAIILGVGCWARQWLPKYTFQALLIGSVIALVPAYDLYQNRIQKGDHGSAKSREHLAGIAIDILSDDPIFGYGAGNCHRACQKYSDQGEFRSEWYYTIHCKYLVVWIETGILGLTFFLLTLGSSIRDGWLAWRTRNRFFGPIGLAISAAIIGQMVHMIVDIFNSRLQVQYLWVLFGLAASARSIAQFESSYPVTETAVEGDDV